MKTRSLSLNFLHFFCVPHSKQLLPWVLSNFCNKGSARQKLRPSCKTTGCSEALWNFRFPTLLLDVIYRTFCLNHRNKDKCINFLKNHNWETCLKTELWNFVDSMNNYTKQTYSDIIDKSNYLCWYLQVTLGNKYSGPDLSETIQRIQLHGDQMFAIGISTLFLFCDPELSNGP